MALLGVLLAMSSRVVTPCEFGRWAHARAPRSATLGMHRVAPEGPAPSRLAEQTAGISHAAPSFCEPSGKVKSPAGARAHGPGAAIPSPAACAKCARRPERVSQEWQGLDRSSFRAVTGIRVLSGALLRAAENQPLVLSSTCSHLLQRNPRGLVTARDHCASAVDLEPFEFIVESFRLNRSHVDPGAASSRGSSGGNWLPGRPAHFRASSR